MNRQCGDCTLCCKLLPVVPLGKGANVRCKYQRHTGCQVYHKPEMPSECAIWNCRWLVNDDTGDQSRPDRAHYVIDLMPDFVETVDNETGERMTIECIQIWIDPKYPDAHKDAALRDYIYRRALEGKVALIRFNSRDAFTLVAPPMASDRQWHEMYGSHTRMHSPEEIVRKLSAPVGSAQGSGK